MTYLLAIRIGPVQEFIAAARRTRDLWFGSTLPPQAKECETHHDHCLRQ